MIPEKLWSALGDLDVEVVEEFEDGETFGEFDPGHRTVKVLATLDPTTAEVTSWHEWVHSVLWDSGVSMGFTNEGEEAICHALATAIVAARKAGLL